MDENESRQSSYIVAPITSVAGVTSGQSAFISGSNDVVEVSSTNEKDDL